MPLPLKLSFLLFSLLFLHETATHQSKHRTKRKVVFSKSSKFFFRLNGKDNVFNYTQVFAHGWSFRVNYDLPESIPRRHQFFKRDVHAEFDSITDGPMPEAYSCVLKYVCEGINAVKRADKCGVFCGIGSIIANTVSLEAEFFRNATRNCDFHAQNCPYVVETNLLSK